MNSRGVIVLVAAVVCGLGTMYFARNALNRGGGTPDPDVDVIVAAKDIPSGMYLNEKINGEPLVKIVKMKKSAVKEDFFTGGQVDMLALTDEKTKRWVKVFTVVDEPINKKKLGDPKTRPGMPSEITKGMRGITIKVDQESGVAGFINPNDRVDVVATYQGSRTAKILLQNVRVLAAGEHLNPDPEKAHLNVASMTLELSPEDANKLRVASSRSARLSLMLRGFNDDHTIPKEKEEMVFGESIEEREALRQKYDDIEKKLNLLVAERIEKEKQASDASLAVAPGPGGVATVSQSKPSRATSIVMGPSKYKLSDAGGSNGAQPVLANPNGVANPNAQPNQTPGQSQPTDVNNAPNGNAAPNADPNSNPSSAPNGNSTAPSSIRSN